MRKSARFGEEMLLLDDRTAICAAKIKQIPVASTWGRTARAISGTILDNKRIISEDLSSNALRRRLYQRLLMEVQNQWTVTIEGCPPSRRMF